MSWFEPLAVTCPHCNAAIEVGVAETINVTRMPWAKAQILQGVFHRPNCPECGGVFQIERHFLYSDFGAEVFVQVFDIADRERWPSLEDQTEEVFYSATENGPPFVQSMAGRFRMRAAFGIDELADKLRIWDAGLNDKLVELMKLELLVKTPSLQQVDTLELTVRRVAHEDELIEVEAWDRAGVMEPMWFGGPLARYYELEADVERLEELFPGLFHRPYVSFRRLAREMHPSTMEAAAK